MVKVFDYVVYGNLVVMAEFTLRREDIEGGEEIRCRLLKDTTRNVVFIERCDSGIPEVLNSVRAFCTEKEYRILIDRIKKAHPLFVEKEFDRSLHLPSDWHQGMFMIPETPNTKKRPAVKN